MFTTGSCYSFVENLKKSVTEKKSVQKTWESISDMARSRILEVWHSSRLLCQESQESVEWLCWKNLNLTSLSIGNRIIWPSVTCYEWIYTKPRSTECFTFQRLMFQWPITPPIPSVLAWDFTQYQQTPHDYSASWGKLDGQKTVFTENWLWRILSIQPETFWLREKCCAHARTHPRHTHTLWFKLPRKECS